MSSVLSFFFLFYCKLKEKYAIRRKSLCNKKSSCRGLLETPYVLNVAGQFSQTSGIEFFFINNNKKENWQLLQSFGRRLFKENSALILLGN